jgi:ATP synthase subunit 10
MSLSVWWRERGLCRRLSRTQLVWFRNGRCPCDDRKMRSGNTRLAFFVFGVALLIEACAAQSLPATEGETLGGHKVQVAQAIRGHEAVLIAGFSKDAGDACGAWGKAAHADSALRSAEVYQLVMLEEAPRILRPMIKSGMRKGLSAAEQERFVILTQDEKLWRSYFGVGNDKEPWVVLIDADGKVLWHGHGAAQYLESLLKQAMR